MNKEYIKLLQKDLLDEGYLKSEKDVDGYIGPITVKALQRKLIDDGFLDKGEDDGIIGRKTRTAVQQLLESKGFLTDKAVTGKRTSEYLNALNDALKKKEFFKDIDLGWFKQALKSDTSNPYMISPPRQKETTNKQKVSNKNSTETEEYWRDRVQNDGGFINNLWPYGYSDEDQRNATLGGMASKVLQGLFGKKKKKKLLDEFVLLDLNTKEGIERAKELSYIFDENFQNKMSLEYLQQSARARYDLNALYSGRPQIFGTFIVNPDYKDSEAEKAAVPTYTYKNPALRRDLQIQAGRFGRKHGVGAHLVQGDPTTTFGNYTVKTTGEDGSGTWRDVWDFMGDPVIPHELVIIADTIPGVKGSSNETYLRPGDPHPVRTMFKNELDKLKSKYEDVKSDSRLSDYGDNIRGNIRDFVQNTLLGWFPRRP